MKKVSPFMLESKAEKDKLTEKLTVDQINKQGYFIHYRGLKLYKRHGIRVINIYTVYESKQYFWLAKFFKNSTEQRIIAKIEFEKHFHKFRNISFYGKTVENIRKRLSFDLIDKSDTHRILNRRRKCSFDDNNAKYKKLILLSIYN